MINRIERITSAQRATNLQQVIKSWVMALAVFGALALSGCATPPANSNSSMNSNAASSAAMNSNMSATANTNTGNENANAVSSAAFASREPDQYSLTMTVTGQGTMNEKQGTLRPQAIEFARMGEDRRWSMTLPLVGQVIYLEKPDVRYLILPSRRQYVELSPESLGVRLGNVMTPSAIVEHLKPRTQVENLGTETVDGRAATKYRFTGATDTHTRAGTVQSDSFVYIDESTGLPLRADLNFNAANGGTARGTIETRNINLNPDPKLFAVPADYKKTTAEELKQQVQDFIQFVRAFAPVAAQQGNEGAPASPPSANANRP